MGRKQPSRKRNAPLRMVPKPDPPPFAEPTPVDAPAVERLVLICGREDGRGSPWVSADIPTEKVWNLPFEAFAAMFLEPMYAELQQKRREE